jgi:hypothetical protein
MNGPPLLKWTIDRARFIFSWEVARFNSLLKMD